MKLVNRTTYDTTALRKLITATHARLAKYEGRAESWHRLTVTVVYSRWGGYSGWATLGGSRMRLRVPSPKRRVATAHEFAWLTEHELFHTHGYERTSTWRSRTTGRWPTRLMPGQRRSTRRASLSPRRR